MREINTCEDRLKAMMLIDKSSAPHRISKVLKAEMLYLLNNYFDLTADDLDLNISIDNNGNYCLNIVANARYLKVAYVIES